MEKTITRSIDFLTRGIKRLDIAERMAFVTFPILGEQKLLPKIFNYIYGSLSDSANSILILENRMSNDSTKNIIDFIEKEKYKLTKEELNSVKEIIELNKKLKESAMEFTRKDKLVLLPDSLKIDTLDIEKIKRFIKSTKEILLKVSTEIEKI